MAPESIEALKWIINLGAMVLLGIGAWIGKGMATDIKKLQRDSGKFEVFMGSIKEHMDGRDKLQDERWKNIDDKINTVQRGVETILQATTQQKQHQK